MYIHMYIHSFVYTCVSMEIYSNIDAMQAWYDFGPSGLHSVVQIGSVSIFCLDGDVTESCK